jgi:lysine 2,3-aminomutase
MWSTAAQVVATADWRQLLNDSVRTPDELGERFGQDLSGVRRAHECFPMCINPYYLGLIREPGDPIWKQAVPDALELDSAGLIDPLAEERDSPVPGLVHRYPDRVLLYVAHECAMYCRFCTRKRKVSDPHSTCSDQVARGLDYIRRHRKIRDVIVSGGDPLTMPDERLDGLLAALRSIEHVEIIRIGTRMPVTLPQRVTPALCEVLKRHHPVYINTHFNHPREITQESARACAMLADAGIPLGNQSVLLRGVNDGPQTMRRLVQKLLAIRVRPYYIYQIDLAAGTQHFRTSVECGLKIIESLRGHTTGMAVPTLVIDAPGGGGKIPIAPESVVSMGEDEIVLRNYKGLIYRYPAHPPAKGD